MGINSFTEEGFFTLGIKVTKVQLTGLYIVEVSKKYITVVVTSSPMIDHAFLKNRAWKPSLS